MSDAQIGRRALLRGAGGLAALAALPSLAACGTGSSRTAGGSGGKGGKTVVVRDSGGSYGAALQHQPRPGLRGRGTLRRDQAVRPGP